MLEISVPAASDPVESRADWLEFAALCSKERRVSLEDLVRIIRREGSVDGLDDVDDARADRGSARSQQVVEEAFAELAVRVKACDGEYPFELEQGLLRLRDDAVAAPYLLLLLLSFKEPTSGHAGTAAMFERLCAHAAKQYFGGEANGASAFRFGSPRRVPLAKLSDAIDHLCKELSEGGGVRDPEYAKHTGDEGLDIVAWKHFPDRRGGKLIAFGQCAGGRVNWTDKLNELDGQKFASKLFRDPMIVAPIRFFFIPRRVPSDNWDKVSIDAGVVFDRCRIVSCLKGLDPTLRRDCAAMLKALTQQIRRSKTPKSKRRKAKKAKTK
jgi:hypothetical protein